MVLKSEKLPDETVLIEAIPMMAIFAHAKGFPDCASSTVPKWLVEEDCPCSAEEWKIATAQARTMIGHPAYLQKQWDSVESLRGFCATSKVPVQNRQYTLSCRSPSLLGEDGFSATKVSE